MESASDINARLSQARRHQWKRVSGERETRLQRLRTAQQLRLAAEKRVAPARQTMIYIRLVLYIFIMGAGRHHTVMFYVILNTRTNVKFHKSSTKLHVSESRLFVMDAA